MSDLVLLSAGAAKALVERIAGAFHRETGAKIDWLINDSNHLELLAFSDGNQTITDSYGFDASTGDRGGKRPAAFDERFLYCTHRAGTRLTLHRLERP